MRSTTQKGRHSLLKTPLSYGDQVLVGGIRGKILGGGWSKESCRSTTPPVA